MGLLELAVELLAPGVDSQQKVRYSKAALVQLM